MDSYHSTNVDSSWIKFIFKPIWWSTKYDLYLIFLYVLFKSIRSEHLICISIFLFCQIQVKLWKFPPFGNFSPVSRQFPSNCRFYFQPSVLSAATLPSFDIFGNPCEILNPKQPQPRNNPICVQLGSHALFKTFPDVWQLGGFGSAGKLYAANVANIA